MAESGCVLCPRQCGALRPREAGACGASGLRLARAALHPWEEPCISGGRGSGTVFFSHCPLGCVYCQNSAISREGGGRAVTVARLADIFLELEARGAHNINLVTPLHFTDDILKALDRVRHRLAIPVAVNCGGYERAETVARWAGYADIWLPDVKYRDSALAARYSGAPDYFDRAGEAIAEMVRQQPRPVLRDGLMTGGVMLRHLVLPMAYRDSIVILTWIAQRYQDVVLLSLMRQFTPTPACRDYPEINRTLTTFEYKKVLETARALGLRGYFQDKGAAGEGYVPAFDGEGLEPEQV